ncbi:MAG: TonB-dependent siderophore receptor [Idiomarinaceae bacterium]|nr:TonB-dependent siderophore receptor [Idiomarinaceae bacterium]
MSSFGSFSLSRLSLALAVSLLSLTVVAQESEQSTTETADDSVAIERIKVDGSQVQLNDVYPGGQVARGGRAGILGNLDMMSSPFSALNFTEELIRDQQAVSVGDVMKNDPVVRVAKGFGNFQEVYILRGFPVYSDDMTYNGLYGILPRQYVAAELLQRVEVFRGANTFLNGAAPGGSGLGGSVNVVPKRAGEQPLTRLTTGVEGNGHVYGAVDIGRRFGDKNESTGVRVNVVERDGETAIEDQDRDLSVVSLGVDYDSEKLRLSADLGYQDHHIDAPRPSVTPTAEIPEPPEADVNFAQDWTFSNERQLFGAVRAEYDLTPAITSWAAAGFRNGKEDNVLANPTATADGDFSAYRFDNVREDNVRSYELGLRSEFVTGAINHQLVLSGSWFSSDSENAYAFSSFAGFAGNLYQPQTAPQPAADFFVGGDLAAPLVTESADNQSFAIADILSFNQDKVLVTLGARQQTIDTQSYDYNTGAPLSGYDDSRLTPMAGIVVKPSEQWSLYANYIEGLQPGAIAPANSGGTAIENAGEVFEPFRSKQYEAGVKYDGGRFGGTLSAYSTKKPSSLIVDNRFTVSGEQTNQGIEFSAFGMLTDHVRLLGGAVFTDAEQSRTQNGIYDGNDAIGVPDLQVNVNAEWDVQALPGLTLDARAIYTGEQYADAANQYTVDSSQRWDIGGRYSFLVGVTEIDVLLRVENLFDENYWASVGGFPGSNYLVLSEPRNVKLSVSVDF